MIHMTDAVTHLAALSVSPLNARARDDGTDDTDLQGLADSIAAVGILHPLVVHDLGEDQGWGVLAGRRRFLALKLLNGSGPPEIPIRIASGDQDELAQASVAENLQRTMMSDTDLLRAIQRIFADGRQPTNEQLAQAFGTGVRRIRQLVRLAHVHPEIYEAFEAEQLDMDDLEKLAKSSDQDEQLRVWHMFESNEIYSHQIDKALGFNDDEGNMRLQFVGADVYTAAGGRLEQDLFDEDERNAKILDPDVLERLVAEKTETVQAEIRASRPGIDVTFAFEHPTDKSGYRAYDLHARADYDDETRAAIAAKDEEIEKSIDVFNSIATKSKVWTHHAEQIAAGRIDITALTAAKQKKWTAEAKKVAAVLADKKALEATPKIVPDKATICVLTIGRDCTLQQSWYFPDHAAAGRTASSSSGSSSSAAPAPPKPGEKGFDPANPALTNKARDHVMGMRVNMAARYVAGDQPRHAETAARAHKALIFTMGWKLAAGQHQGTESVGLIHGFAGDLYGFSGTALERVKAPEVPGLDAKKAADGWAKFEAEATPEQVDQLAAWLFARKIEPVNVGGKTPTIVQDVFGQLAHDHDVRQSAGPDLDGTFWALFPKAVLAAIAGTVAADHSKAVLAAKGEAPKEYLDTLVGKATVTDAGWKWVPAFLRFGKAGK